MSGPKHHVVVVGAGLVGLSSALFLSQLPGVAVTVLEQAPAPMSVTSANSTGGFRNYYPANRAMAQLSSRSIDLLRALRDSTGGDFQMLDSGYLFVSKHDDDRIRTELLAAALKVCSHGGGDVRYNGVRIATSGTPFDEHAVNLDMLDRRAGGDAPFVADRYWDELATRSDGTSVSGAKPGPDGFDIIDRPDIIRTLVPMAASDIKLALHVRKAGYLHVEQLGRCLVRQVQQTGASIRCGESISGAIWDDPASATKRLIGIRTNKSSCISCDAAVIAAGPYLRTVGSLFGVDFPVVNELHGRAVVKDPIAIVPAAGPRVPMTLGYDDIGIPLSDEERRRIDRQAPQFNWLLGTIGSGVHCRPAFPGEYGTPESEKHIAAIWTYHADQIDTPAFPTDFDSLYAAVVLRGLKTIVPRAARYSEDATAADHAVAEQSSVLPLLTDRAVMQSGYYNKTSSNVPIIGPMRQLVPADGDPGFVQGTDALLDGAFVAGAVSGLGVMNCLGIGELITAHVRQYLERLAPLSAQDRAAARLQAIERHLAPSGSGLPPYAQPLDMKRTFAVPGTVAFEKSSATGQL